jgi:transposase
VDDRQVIDGMIYKIRTGITWRACPNGTARGRRSRCQRRMVSGETIRCNSPSWGGKPIEESGKESAVCRREARFAGLPLQDGELVAQREDLDVLVGVTHR